MSEREGLSQNRIFRALTYVLAGIGVLSLLFFAVAFYLNSEFGGEDGARQIHALRAEGAAFGARSDAASCLDESYARMTGCDDFFCETRITMGFLAGCLETAAASPSACREVHRLVTEERDWTPEYCTAVDKDYDQCLLTLSHLIQYCQDVKRDSS